MTCREARRGDDVRALVRDPARADDLRRAGIERAPSSYGATSLSARSRSVGASSNVFSIDEESTTKGDTNW